VNLRAGPSTKHARKALLPRGTPAALLEVGKSWCRVSARGEQGWVHRDYLCKSPQGLRKLSSIGQGVILGDRVNVRVAPSLGYQIVARASKGSPVAILADTGDWYLVRFANDFEGWVARRLVGAGQGPNPTAAPKLSKPAASGEGASVVDSAFKYMGAPYQRAGESPSGFDCSGFVRFVFSLHGRKLPHGADDQFACGTPVPVSDLQPGDVVFFRNTYRPGISHTGIYIGDNQFIHASSAAGGVVVTPLGKTYYASRYAGARRML